MGISSQGSKATIETSSKNLGSGCMYWHLAQSAVADTVKATALYCKHWYSRIEAAGNLITSNNN